MVKEDQRNSNGSGKKPKQTARNYEAQTQAIGKRQKDQRQGSLNPKSEFFSQKQKLDNYHLSAIAIISIYMEQQQPSPTKASTEAPLGNPPQELQDNEFVEEKGEEVINQQQIPDHFYDSDLASVNEKDFLSDNEPPKDQIEERKLLYKEKKLHVFKTIVRLGVNIDKPARYDKIKLKYKAVPAEEVKPYPLKKSKIPEYVYPSYFSSFYLMDAEEVEYNLGKEHLDIERLVTSMKRGETAVFEMQNLEISKKSGIKLRQNVDVVVIGVENWLTVIDMDCDGKYMKEIVKRGEGHNRINQHDEVFFQFNIKRGQDVRLHQKYEDSAVKLEEDAIEALPNIVWKLISNMKNNEIVRVYLTDQLMQECQGQKFDKLKKETDTNEQQWQVNVEIFSFHSIDDIFMDGQLLKKILVRGISTAKADSSSIVYYALKFINGQKETIFMDPFFQSDWWQDFAALEKLNCRKSYLDDYSVSKMLKESIKRMKPAEIAEIQCRDNTMFTFGSDYQDYKKYLKVEVIPQTVFLVVRVYNFTEGKNCFNMEIDEKVEESKRKKAIGVRLLKQGRIDKALKTFENIVAFYGSGKINQQGYNEKISSLMNSILCHMKKDNFLQIIKLSEQILQHPKHGFDQSKLKIKGPMNAKIEGKAPEQADGDQRQDAELIQNQQIIDKCLYRKALALTKIGEGKQALDCLAKISTPTEQVLLLKKQAQKLKQNYQKKSVKMYKNMFG